MHTMSYELENGDASLLASSNSVNIAWTFLNAFMVTQPASGHGGHTHVNAVIALLFSLLRERG